mgnify:CR=1 FL=1
MLIYAHRGASADFPEHTLEAYEAAVEQGADGFECDVRLSKDGVAVLWHNATMLERAGNDGWIAEMTFAEIRKAYPQILTLEKFLEFAIAKKKGVLIETKHPVISGNRIEEEVVRLLYETKALNRIDVAVMSFSWFAIEKVKRLDPYIKTTFLLRERTRNTFSKTTSAKILGPSIEELHGNDEYQSYIKSLNKPLYIWTVDTKAHVELAQELGARILITNKPAHARACLK